MAVLEKPYIYATKCGDNCVPDILEIARKKDVHITLHHIMQFPERKQIGLVIKGY